MILRLGPALEASCPEEWAVTQGVEVRISRSRSLVPDVLVVSATAAAEEPSRFRPHDLLLAVEVVSSNSKAMDRITKQALFAQAGIPFYWRVETERGIVVHTYRLAPEGDVYGPTGTFDSTVKIAEPWPIEVAVSQITPPFYRPQSTD